MRISYQQQLEASYQRAFREFAHHINGMERELAKLTVASSKQQQTRRWHDLERLVYAAQANLGQLPVSTLSLSRMEHYIAAIQTHAVRNILKDELVNEDEISILYEQAQYVNREIQNSLARFETMDSWTDWKRYWQASVMRSSNVVPGERNPLMQSLVMIEDGMQRFPDSEFPSELDRLRNIEFTGKQISKDEASKIAKDFVDNGEEYQFEVVEESGGEIPTFTVKGVKEGSEITLEISQQDGLVLWMINPRRVGEVQLAIEEMIDKGRNFLADRGFTPVELIYYQEWEDRVLLAFARKRDQVVIYPEQLKVQIAKDNGEIVSFQSLAYHSFQVTRPLTPELTVEEARNQVAKGEIVGEQLVVIFNEIYQEVLAYEFRVLQNQDEFLVYLNAHTGREERITRVEPGQVIGY